MLNAAFVLASTQICNLWRERLTFDRLHECAKIRLFMTTKSKFCRSLAILVLLAALSGAGFVLHLAARHNFHSVSEGRVYRSAQMNAYTLAETIREQGIRTVVNLRGDNSG